MTRTIQEALSSTGDPSQQPVQYVETVEAYNKWAKVYDTDGNFLQALDTIEMRNLLPQLLRKVTASTSSSSTQPKLIDLGCGTGRNTIQLLRNAPSDATIVGLDASPGMLEIARDNIQKETGTAQTQVELGILDLLQSPLVLPDSGTNATGIISTLVMEHIPVKQFFEAAAGLLLPGGYLLVTNMHSEMGAISQAGFVDDATGVKIRPTSYSHTVADTLVAADMAGFDVEELDGEAVRERKIDSGIVESLGKRAEKWVGVTVWFGICFRKRS